MKKIISLVLVLALFTFQGTRLFAATDCYALYNKCLQDQQAAVTEPALEPAPVLEPPPDAVVNPVVDPTVDNPTVDDGTGAAPFVICAEDDLGACTPATNNQPCLMTGCACLSTASGCRCWDSSRERTCTR